MKKVLNVGGNSKAIPLPAQYKDYEHIMLDIDPKCMPDVLCDARALSTLAPAQFDAIYCSHNLEHYFKHDVKKVLAGFLHVLKDGGFAQIRVPDIIEVIQVTLKNGLDLDDKLYDSPAGPITALDVLYGFSKQIEKSGHDFFAHKTGFTQKSLIAELNRAGFTHTVVKRGFLEFDVIASKGKLDTATQALLNLDKA